MSKVYFASAKMSALRADASLPAKFKRMLANFPLKGMFDGKTVAIKMHLGANIVTVKPSAPCEVFAAGSYCLHC
ncbi:MAG: hypothetical protein ACP5R5_08965 [Armatimonadota bacterium]